MTMAEPMHRPVLRHRLNRVSRGASRSLDCVIMRRLGTGVMALVGAGLPSLVLLMLAQTEAEAAGQASFDDSGLGIWVAVAIAATAVVLGAWMRVSLRRSRDAAAAAHHARAEVETDLRRLRDELETSLARRSEEINAANQELAAFVYSVSHDLRAPLRAIDGFSRLLSTQCSEQLDDQGRHFIDRIRAGTDTMNRSIDGILRLSRIGHETLTPSVLDLSAVVRSVADTLGLECPERRIDLMIQDGVSVYGDKRSLTLAIENLLGNAFKYTRDKDQAQIEFAMKEEFGNRVFVIRDNGAGFDMAYADKLFKPFQRLHNAGEFEGNGIGLATVYNIIRRHKGRIWAEGAVGKGAVFYFTLGDVGESGYGPGGDSRCQGQNLRH